MVSELFFYELALFGLLWLYVMLAWAWPSGRVIPGPTPPPASAATPQALRRPQTVSRPHPQAPLCRL